MESAVLFIAFFVLLIIDFVSAIAIISVLYRIEKRQVRDYEVLRSIENRLSMTEIEIISLKKK